MTARLPITPPPAAPLTAADQLPTLSETDGGRPSQFGSPTIRTWYWANSAADIAFQVLPGTIVTAKPARSAAYCSRLIATPSFMIGSSSALNTESPLMSAVFGLLASAAPAPSAALTHSAAPSSTTAASSARRISIHLAIMANSPCLRSRRAAREHDASHLHDGPARA